MSSQKAAAIDFRSFYLFATELTFSFRCFRCGCFFGWNIIELLRVLIHRHSCTQINITQCFRCCACKYTAVTLSRVRVMSPQLCTCTLHTGANNEKVRAIWNWRKKCWRFMKTCSGARTKCPEKKSAKTRVLAFPFQFSFFFFFSKTLSIANKFNS